MTLSTRHWKGVSLEADCAPNHGLTWILFARGELGTDGRDAQGWIATFRKQQADIAAVPEFKDNVRLAKTAHRWHKGPYDMQDKWDAFRKQAQANTAKPADDPMRIDSGLFYQKNWVQKYAKELAFTSDKRYIDYHGSGRNYYEMGQSMGNAMVELLDHPAKYPLLLHRNGKYRIGGLERHANDDYHVWARIGYEFVRSEFQWRIDRGQWQACLPDTPTVNVQPIQIWNELAWIRLATRQLSAGKHRIEFKHYKHKTRDDKGNESPSRILHMLDAICISSGRFIPAGKWRPDQGRKRSDSLA